MNRKLALVRAGKSYEVRTPAVGSYEPLTDWRGPLCRRSGRPTVTVVTHLLVTGGAGFIGSHLTAALLAADHDVSVLDSAHPAAHTGPVRVPDGVRLHRADVRDADAVRAALRGVDAVLHQAALVGLGAGPGDLPEYVGCNDLGTAVLLAAMTDAGVKRLVLASSMVVYGEGAYRCDRHGPVRPAPRAPGDLESGRFEPPCPECGRPLGTELVGEDAPLDPRSVYAATKVAQEHLAAIWARECGASVAALRYHNVYGPGMPRDTPYSGCLLYTPGPGSVPTTSRPGGRSRSARWPGRSPARSVAPRRW